MMKTNGYRLILCSIAALATCGTLRAQVLDGGKPSGTYGPLHAWYDVNQSLDVWEGRTDQYDDEFLVDVRDTETGSGAQRGESYGTNVETWAQFDDTGGDFWPERVGGLTGNQNGLATWEVRNAAGWDDGGGWTDEDGIGTDGIGLASGYTIMMAMNVYDTISFDGTWDAEPNGPNEDTPILNGSTAAFNEGASDDPFEGKGLLWLDASRDGYEGPVWVMDAGIEMVAGPVTLDQWQVHTFVFDGDDSKHFIDGEEVAAGEAGDFEMTSLQFFSTDGGWHRAGNLDFAEGLFYDEVLASDDRIGLEQYLSSKWGIGPTNPYDYDGDGELGLGDMNLLLEEVNRGTNDPKFDVTQDGAVDALDVTQYASDPEILNTYLGDANLDGEFDTSDLVLGLAGGQYEDNVAGNSRWETGDWTGDLEFDTSDLVAGLAQGGYESGPRAAVAAVPEPSSLALLLLGVILSGLRRRRSH